MDNTILVVEDESVQLESIAGFLSKQGYRVLKSSRPQRALEIAGEEAVDIVLSDFRMPEMSGVELLSALKHRNPGIEVIIMTAFGSVESAIEAMKLGAVDYITKPVDLHQLQIMIRNTLERKQLISENRLLRTQLSERFGFQGIVSQSSAMDQVLNIAGRVASSNAAVLITGETGTGKELVAKAVHFSGSRRDKPFIVVNCAALPETLLESELFGHEKGAFTGADRMRRGRFELAQGGTLFIDEVGEIPLSLQVKLLRVLQEKTFERVGSSTPLEADVRIVAATNRDLESMIRQGSFRADLYYRLNVVSIRIPPLRGRREDIPPLVDAFLQRFSKENGKQITGISREAMDALMKYSWPGNVRELENIVQQSVVLSRSSTITRDDLPIRVSEPHPEGSGPEVMQGSFTEKVEAFEQAMILGALKDAGNIQTRAAEMLGISERHLRYKLKKYGMK
ncbi:MAG: sigma-54-dependent Fis family transcriptional regulator [Chlorobiaceae bacterium]|nr:sigma-54-dependent Fis family transcriptional regulator [Chlorobiaceae bacterium]